LADSNFVLPLLENLSVSFSTFDQMESFEVPTMRRNACGTYIDPSVAWCVTMPARSLVIVTRSTPAN